MFHVAILKKGKGGEGGLFVIVVIIVVVVVVVVEIKKDEHFYLDVFQRNQVDVILLPLEW